MSYDRFLTYFLTIIIGIGFTCIWFVMIMSLLLFNIWIHKHCLVLLWLTVPASIAALIFISLMLMCALSEKYILIDR